MIPITESPGVIFSGGKTHVTLYAPDAGKAWLVLPEQNEQRPLDKQDGGYFRLICEDVPAQTPYLLRTDRMSEARPDPASRFQPQGVHAPSVVVDANLFWRKQPYWPGRLLADMLIYELHIGTFSKAGTFAGAIELLPQLVKLGVNTIELMPINQFPGKHNWGYDGVYWQAVQESYGGPAGLVAFIDAAHELDLAVLIDAVYNHLGPEGNYLPEFAPYLTDKHHTPWGAAVNLDDYGSDGVRDFILASAKTWLVDYGADGLRLDAVHALKDSSATHLLEQLSTAVAGWSKELRKPLTLIAECDLNDPRYVKPVREGGYGLTGQWVDEFHHALRTYLTGETQGYYADFQAKESLVEALKRGYVYTGQYSKHRGRRFGKPSTGLKNHQFIVFGQNHDQVGNRALGDRLHEHLSEDEYLLQAATTIWSPFTPMLWMGEEYAEEAPFPYFVDHTDEAILTATREGRMREFAPFLSGDQQVPDPGEKQTFLSAKLSHKRRGRIYKFYREALAVRRQFWPLRNRDISAHDVATLRADVIAWAIPLTNGKKLIIIVNFSGRTFSLAASTGTWAVAQADLRCSTTPLDGSLPAKAAGVWLL